MQDLLLISDLHLGSHLKPRMRGEFVHLAARIEDIFPRFIDHYLREGRGGGWQLVINGDFIDFWHVELPDEAGLRGEDLAVRRLHAVLDEYPNVEDALVRFLKAGHSIVFVTGNHDAELLYPGVRKAILARLESAMDLEDADITRTGIVDLRQIPPGRVRFVRWFLREEGGAWIEHGHKFDPTCATSASLSPMRGGVLVKTVAEVATRSFGNRMPEIDHDAPDRFTLLDYIRWAGMRGMRFIVRAVLLYLRMVSKVVLLWAGAGRVDRAGREQHERLMMRVADNAGLQMGALMALEGMAPPPAAATVGGIMSVIALDVVLAVILPFALVVGLLPLAGVSWWIGVLVGAALSLASVRGVLRQRKPRNVAQDMLEVAARVGELVQCPLVLMGHSHRGTLERLGDVVYANSGSWLDGSHLVVRRDGSGRLVEVDLRMWRNNGIVRTRTMRVPRAEPEAVAESSRPDDRPSPAAGEVPIAR